MTNVIPLTDHRGTRLVPDNEAEPLPGSVVLTEGLHGTAWQRFFSDGRWHPTRGGGSKTWAQLLSKRNLVLVYDATPREEQAGGYRWERCDDPNCKFLGERVPREHKHVAYVSPTEEVG